jgi:hypothetical protein
MNNLYGNSNFNNLLQECYLARVSILSGIEYLLKAEIFDEHSDGLFYSSFYSLSIGIERFLKLTLITEYMYCNQYKKVPIERLKDLNHDLVKLYDECNKVANKYNIQTEILDSSNEINYQLVNHLSKYAQYNRYQNLDDLTDKFSKGKFKKDIHPIHEWMLISKKIVDQHISKKKYDRDLTKIINQYPYHGYSHYLDFDGQILHTTDLFTYKFIVNTAKPYALFKLIQLLKPFYKLLDKLSMDCNNGPEADLKGAVKLPYYGELFPFFYISLDQLKRTKKWVNRY